jgi:hypothetical protein
MSGPGDGKTQRRSLWDIFYCRARRRRLNLQKCMTDFMNANAFDKQKSACWHCVQGRENRDDYSKA